PLQVLATEDAVERSRTRFETTKLAPFSVKGKAEPVVAHSVGPPLGRLTRESDTPFVGRERELAVLMEAFERASESRGAGVGVVAGPGMGKSRVIDETSNRAGWERIVSGHGEEYERATPYFGLRGLLADALSVRPDDEKRLRSAVARVAPRLVPWFPLIGTA